MSSYDDLVPTADNGQTALLDPAPAPAAPFTLPPLAVSALMVTKADLVAALRAYLPHLSDIEAIDGDRFLLVVGPHDPGTVRERSALMSDCACTNFPAGLGIVTIGAGLGVGTMTLGPNAKIDVRSGGTTTPMAIMFGRTGEDGTLAVAGENGQWSEKANAGDTTLRSMTASLNLSVQNHGGRILFTTGTHDTVKMAITNFGHVGIGLGDTMPAERLEVRGPSAISPVAITIGRSGSAADGALAVAAGDHQWAGPTVAGDVVLRASSASGSLVLAAITSGRIVFATGGGLDPRMTVTNTGNVGIGTVNPQAKLEVDGPASGQGYTADFSGDLKVGGVIDCVGNIAISGSGRAYFAGSRRIADGNGCYYA